MIMNRSKRNLAINAIVGSLAFGGLITGTFAWFAAANSVSIDTFKVTYGGGDDLKIGLIVPEDHPELGNAGDIQFFDELSEKNLVDYGYFNPEKKLSPVSSMFQSRWLNETTDLSDESLLPVLREGFTSYYNTTDSKVASSGFYQFEFYFKSNMDMYLYLDDSSTLLPDSDKNAEDPAGNEEALNNVHKSMRVSFLSSYGFNIWEPNTVQASTTIFAGRLDILSRDGYYDFNGEIDEYREIMFGEMDGSTKIIYSENGRANAVDPTTTFNASTYASVLPIDMEASLANGLVLGQETSKTTEELADKDQLESALAYLPEETPVRVVVTIYSEGWDRDNNDFVERASFLLALRLTGRYRAPSEPIALKK